jgi:hypothetical protein
MTRIPRAIRKGERIEHKRADQLTDDDRGRIVQHPGNRGWLHCADPEDGGIRVLTTTCVAVYPPDAEFSVWGYDERDAVRRRWQRAAAARVRKAIR